VLSGENATQTTKYNFLGKAPIRSKVLPSQKFTVLS
jgi:hypothetical protein